MKFDFFSPAPRPDNERERQAAVDVIVRRGVADQARLDAIVAEAADLLDCPISALSIIDGERQWFAGITGLDAEETSRAASFCAHTILDPERLLYVPDAAEDWRFTGNPLVKDGPQIRFYVGAPVIMADGAVVGALCAIDTRTRTLEPHALQRLRELAAEAATTL
ncbi:GAF domain-containing protein [uncultured Sphingomonas sp.]|uniref:GAF domain-containing protein n=1 Tax=uncultured Sphingomonas sp. TaxID=158754 RepID=UPI0025E056F9|nr:GAF domain-containing protein [uncultured Sphingomonas sp.]